MARVAFIGLGVMGFPMAGHLANAGHEVCVYNRTQAKAELWCKTYNGRLAATPAEAATGADFIFTCVGNDDDLLSVTAGENGALKGMTAGSILIDHTTASADAARNLDQLCRAQGVSFLDAPVSGGQAGAENGRLSIMLGGATEDYTKAAPVFECYAASHKLLGPAGSGQLAKMVNQIAIAGLVQGLSEAVHFVKQAGLDGNEVFDVIQHGAAGSWQMINRHQTMLKNEFDFGFAVDWMRKDLSIALNEARRNGARLPVTALVDQFYADIQAEGGGRLDTSSLLKRLEKGA